MKSLRLVIQFQIFCLMLCLSLNAQVKDTHKIIEEWVETKLIISEESSKWESEKAALFDLQNALTQEIKQLDESLQTFQKEETTIEEERSIEEPLAIAMLIDVFTERGFTAVVDIRKMEVPSRIDPKSYEIINRSKKVYRVRINFPGSKIRRGL